MSSAFLSVAFSCKHQRFLGNLYLARDLWEFKKFFHDGRKDQTAKPDLCVVLLLSGTKMFFDLALLLYAVGLGVYLGSVWLSGTDADAEVNDSRNIFIWFLISVFLCCCVYWGLDRMTDTGHKQGWTCHLKWFCEGLAPCMGNDCNRKTCSPDSFPKTMASKPIQEIADKRPFFLRFLFFWYPSRSECLGSCGGGACSVATSHNPRRFCIACQVA